MLCFYAPGMTGSRKLAVRNVKTGDDFYDSRYFIGFF